MPSTIPCPHCKGQVGHRRGQSLQEALERHVQIGCPAPMVRPVKTPPVVTSVASPKRVRVIPADNPKRRKR